MNATERIDTRYPIISKVPVPPLMCEQAVKATVDLCSCASYGMQCRFEIDGVAGQLRLHRRVHPEEFTGEVFNDMLKDLAASLAICKTPRCGRIAYTGKQTNRDGKCEACFMAELNAEFAKAKAKEDAKEAKRDAKHKAKGYRFKLDGWIHPKGGGDDYQCSVYFGYRPEAAEVEALLAKHGSAVTNDYKIIEL